MYDPRSLLDGVGEEEYLPLELKTSDAIMASRFLEETIAIRKRK